MQEAQDSLLAGKYKSAQDLENAYIELEKKLGSNSQEKSEEVTEESTEDSTEPTNETEPKEEKSSEPFILDTLWDKAKSGTKFTEEDIATVRETDPADLVNAYLEFRSENGPRDLPEETIKSLRNVPGGEKEYNEMMDWAGKNLNEQEIGMFDQVMDRGDPVSAFFAVRALTYRYHDSIGYEGKMVTGTTPKQNTDVFRSQAEVVKAMNDTRYDNDPAYRQDIMRKLERSEVNF